jgi:hypothetical protein
MAKKLNKLGVENSLWNNIRANKGSGKEPTKDMLKQERKINAKYAGGGKVPIKVTDPNDPRLRAYNDSNVLYNQGVNLKNLIENSNLYNKIPEHEKLIMKNNNSFSTQPFGKITGNGIGKFIDNSGKKITLKSNKKIQPIDNLIYTRNESDYKTRKEARESFDNNEFIDKNISWIGHGVQLYKKPVQPYIYEKSKPVIEQNKQQPIVQEQQFQPDIVNTVTPQDKTKLYQGYDFMQETGLRPGDYTESQIQDAMKAKGTKKLSNKYAKGGRVLPKFKPGGTWNGVDANGNAIQTNFANSTAGSNLVTGAGIAGSVVPMLTSFIPDNEVKDAEGNVLGSEVNVGKGALNGAAQGASMGMVAGPWGAAIGAGLGAIYGGITASSDNDALNEAKRKANIGIGNKNLSTDMTSNKNNYSVNRYNNNQMIAANGGTVINEDMGNPNAELELNETFRDPMTGETGMVDGPSHDDGGIEMSLAEGTQIWSDRLKHNGRTFASLTKPIINKIANIEKGLGTNPNSRFKQNSIKLLNAQLDFFFNVQESNKQQDEMKRTLKKQEGGVVDDMGNYHYANGGIYIKPENRNMMAMGGMMKYPGGGVKRKKISTSTFEPRALTPFPSLSQKDISEQLILNNAGDNLDTPIPKSLNNFDSKNYNTFMGGFKNDLNNVRNYKMGFGQPNENAWDKKEYSFGPNGAGGDQYTFDKIGTPTYQEPVTQPKNNSRVLRNNNGELIQAAALAGSTFAELNNINRQAAPGVRSNVRLTGNIPNPRYVDLSAERGAINRSVMNAMGDAQRSFGNSASAQAFKNKARINQLEGAGKSYQTQENLNSDIYNKFAGMQGEAAMKEAMMNNEIENANLENRFNFAQSKMRGQNAAYATLGHGVGDIGRNRTIFSNDMEKANVLSNQYESSVLADIYKRNPQLLEEAYKNGQISKKA